MSTCSVCGTRKERPAPHADKTKEYYNILIKPLSHIAYRYGYALATHGSLGFDIDLIACPWRDGCADAESLANAIKQATKQIIGYAEIWSCDECKLPIKKPQGRLAWTFYLVMENIGYSGPYIDLSIMPTMKNEE